MLTSYQSSLEEEQNQQLLVRLVLSHFQAQSLERQAQRNMESLLEEDSLSATKQGASKRKLKKDRRLKRQELADSEAAPWDEEQELMLLTQMGWNQATGSSCAACGNGESSAPGAEAGQSTSSTGATPLSETLSLEPLEPGDPGKDGLTEEELQEWETQKSELLEKRQGLRSELKQRFEQFCERPHACA